MTEYERAVLTILARVGEPLGWYRIEMRLTQVTIRKWGKLPDVLEDMTRRGFLTHIQQEIEPRDLYQLTEDGRRALEQIE